MGKVATGLVRVVPKAALPIEGGGCHHKLKGSKANCLAVALTLKQALYF